jgi:hypothetical protein
MPELTPSTREAARRLGVSDTALRKAEQTNRIAREPDGQWDIDKTRRRLAETADPARSPLANGSSAEGTPFARLKVAQLALKVEAQRLSLDETKRRLLDAAEGATERAPNQSGRGSRVPAWNAVRATLPLLGFEGGRLDAQRS